MTTAEDFQIVAYTYKADEYCPDCIVGMLGVSIAPGCGGNTESHLDVCAHIMGIDREDESGFDSDDFPKIILGYQLGTDSEGQPRRCGKCGKVLGNMPDDPCDCPNGPTFHQATTYCTRKDTA